MANELLRVFVQTIRKPGTRFKDRYATSFWRPSFFPVAIYRFEGRAYCQIPGKNRYAGRGELRWDVVNRWSVVFFGGTGTAFDEWNEFDNSKWIGTVGSGFRYMLARKFKLRVGLDIAKGPGEWAYYIIFGSNWGK